MKNHAVAQHAPAFPRKQCHEIFFDTQGCGFCGQAKSRRKPRDVGVDHDPDVDAKSVPKDHVCGFASNSRQGDQCLYFLGDLTLMVLHQLLRGPVQEFGFVPTQSDGFDVFPNGFG